jgi:hypothetical protein
MEMGVVVCDGGYGYGYGCGYGYGYGKRRRAARVG